MGGAQCEAQATSRPNFCRVHDPRPIQHSRHTSSAKAPWRSSWWRSAAQAVASRARKRSSRARISWPAASTRSRASRSSTYCSWSRSSRFIVSASASAVRSLDLSSSIAAVTLRSWWLGMRCWIGSGPGRGRARVWSRSAQSGSGDALLQSTLFEYPHGVMSLRPGTLQCHHLERFSLRSPRVLLPLLERVELVFQRR